MNNNNRRFLKTQTEELVLKAETFHWVKDLSPSLSSQEKYKDNRWNGSGHMTKKLSYTNLSLMQCSATLLLLITFFVSIRLYKYDAYRDVLIAKKVENEREKENDDFDQIPLNESGQELLPNKNL